MPKDDNVKYMERLSANDALRILRELARDSGKVFLSPHAKGQMIARKFTRKQVIDSFQTCRFFEEPHWSLKHGNWQMTVEASSMDDWIRVAVSLNNRTDDEGTSNYIMVITVIRVEGK